MLDPSEICDRLMTEAARIDPGVLTPYDEDGIGLYRLRDKAANLRHLADLAREHSWKPAEIIEPSEPVELHMEGSATGCMSNHVSAFISTAASVCPSYRKILRECAEEEGVSTEDLKGPWRRKDIVRARQKAAWRMRHETMMSFPEIGRKLGDRDHTTILSAVRKHQSRIDAGEC